MWHSIGAIKARKQYKIKHNELGTECYKQLLSTYKMKRKYSKSTAHPHSLQIYMKYSTSRHLQNVKKIKKQPVLYTSFIVQYLF